MLPNKVNPEEDARRCLLAGHVSRRPAMALSGASTSNEVVSSGAVPFISGHQVRLLVSMADLIQEMRRALELFSAGPAEGGVVQPVRSMVPVEERGGWVVAVSMLSRESLFTFSSDHLSSLQSLSVCSQPLCWCKQLCASATTVTSAHCCSMAATFVSLCQVPGCDASLLPPPQRTGC